LIIPGLKFKVTEIKVEIIVANVLLSNLQKVTAGKDIDNEI